MAEGKIAKVVKSDDPSFRFTPSIINVPRPFGGIPGSVFLETATPIDSSHEQTLVFEQVVPKDMFMRFATPCAYVCFEVRKKVGDNYVKVDATDNVFFKNPASYVNKIELLINNKPVPACSQTDEDLERLHALNLRLSGKGTFQDPYNQVRSLVFLKNHETDVTSDNTATPLCKRWRQQVTANAFYAPLAWPIFPFQTLVYENLISGRTLEDGQPKPFPEDCKILLMIHTNKASHMVKYLDQPGKTAATKLDLSIKVTRFFFVLSTETFGHQAKFLESFRDARSKNKLHYPMVDLAAQHWNLEQGKAKTVSTFRNSQCNWRFMILILVVSEDAGDATTGRAKNTSDFSWPTQLKSFDIKIYGKTDSSLIKGPIVNASDEDLDDSKLLFFQNRLPFLTDNPSFLEYYAQGYVSQQVVVDLTNALGVYGSFQNMPIIEIIQEWKDTGCPANCWLVAYGGQNGGLLMYPNDATEVISRVLHT